MLNTKSKHIDLRFAICKEYIQELKIFDLWYLPTQFQLADINTKAVCEKVFRSIDPQIRGLISVDLRKHGEHFSEYVRRLKAKKSASKSRSAKIK